MCTWAHTAQTSQPRTFITDLCVFTNHQKWDMRVQIPQPNITTQFSFYTLSPSTAASRLNYSIVAVLEMTVRFLSCISSHELGLTTQT
jgi:hypothetical protein